MLSARCLLDYFSSPRHIVCDHHAAAACAPLLRLCRHAAMPLLPLDDAAIDADILLFRFDFD